ncbi:zinc-binding alcohol dehydrogenase family protein [Kineosporia sp. J2-2]|uniref:Zinc-binding alcohol dehydrogenase family protein n=1 Tax=Kineosporia corallincola TaxID=2835133 RepID=A0ABS5TRM8_9ACTN|nr:zinc-binding alcohol dehydrogenase family protein [Kineosporia corallincola]MBT0773450.1 zinc-binding alcohol dehydrogenase family protein [Kineosporia corallincola]
MSESGTALWMPRRGARLVVGPAPYTPPGPGEVVVRVRAVAVNFFDTLPAIGYRVVLPWVRFPAVIGSDVAGEVVEVGPGVTRLHPGDRVVGQAFGLERNRNRPAEGAFQQHVVLMQHMVAPLPAQLSFERAAVLPMAVSTAATGLFQPDHLGLALPTTTPQPQDSTVLVWGGSTSVGVNAVQLAHNAGYRVVATASPRNRDWVHSMGAAEVVDYRSTTAVAELAERIGDRPLAGTIAIGRGSLPPAVQVAARTIGTRRVASAQPGPITNLRARSARRRGVDVSVIWGGTLKDNAIGPAVWTGYLPAALASGTHRATPDATVVGHGLEAIPDALDRLRGGISGEKLVVTL